MARVFGLSSKLIPKYELSDYPTREPSIYYTTSLEKNKGRQLTKILSTAVTKKDIANSSTFEKIERKFSYLQKYPRNTSGMYERIIRLSNSFGSCLIWDIS